MSMAQINPAKKKDKPSKLEKAMQFLDFAKTVVGIGGKVSPLKGKMGKPGDMLIDRFNLLDEK